MATDLTPNPAPQIVDLTGLPESVVQEVKRLVQEARERQTSVTPGPNTPGFRPPLSAEELDRLIDELSSGPPGKVLPADFSRADIYDDHD